MPKLPVISGKELVAALRKAGFVEVRHKGSHVLLQKNTARCLVARSLIQAAHKSS